MRTLSVALALVLLVLVPAMPSRAVPKGDGAESAPTGGVFVEEPAPANPTPAAAAAPPVLFDPNFCQPVERRERALATPVPAASPVAAIDPVVWDSSRGIPADNVTFRLLIDAVTAFLACSNAGDADAARTMVTDAHRWRLGATAAPAVGNMSEDAWLTFTEIDDVRLHGVDGATVFLLMQDPGYCDWDVDLAVAFRMVGGVWLVDGLADVSGAEPVAYTPPIFRGDDFADCDSGA